MEIVLTALIMIVCLASEAFFTGSEIGVVSADRMKLRHDAAKGSRGAKLALEMLKNPEWLLSTTLVGTNISVVANTTIATALVIHLLGEDYSWLAVAIVAPLIWVFGEIVPKSIFQQRADNVTPYAIFILRAAAYLFFPILIVFTVLSRALTRMLGDGERRNPFTLREEIVSMMDMTSLGSDIEPHEKTMIRRVFNFDETTAGDVMTPIGDVVAIEAGATCAEATGLASRSAYKRLPVYQQRVENIIGTVNALDLLLEDEEQSIRPFVRRPVRIPRALGIGRLLATFRSRGGGGGGSMAVVVDAAGHAEGIVTLEDILEEVVGEIEDEYDGDGETAPRVRRLGERDYVINARSDLKLAEKELGLVFPRGNYETLAGFLLKIAREIPADGAVIRHRGITFTVKHANAQAIEEVRVTW